MKETLCTHQEIRGIDNWKKSVTIADFDLCMVGRRVIDFYVDKKNFQRKCLSVIRDKINILWGSNF